MIYNVKRKTLTFLLLTVIVTVVIAAALPQFELKPGLPLPFQAGNPGTPPSSQIPEVSISINTFLKAVMESILVVVGVYIGYKLLKRVPWKEILGPVLTIATLVMVAVCVLFLMLGVHVNTDYFAPEILPPALNMKGPPLGPLPPGLIWLVWIGLAVGIILLGIWFFHWSLGQTRAGDTLELEAERAMQALKAGSDLKNVIVRCYLQMSQALQKEQGIKLEETMTAREFERLLEARGLPPAPVHQLTQLFEAARYGYQQPDFSDEQKAFDCLTAIVQYSRERRQSDG